MIGRNAAVDASACLKLRAEHEFNAARRSDAGGACIQYPGDAPEAGRRPDRGRVSADRAYARPRNLVLRMVEEVECGSAEIQIQPLGNPEALLQRRIDLVRPRSVRNIASQISPASVG